MIQIILPLVLGYLLDLVIGDPHGLWHPVCGIGKLIKETEKVLRRWTNGSRKKVDIQERSENEHVELERIAAKERIAGVILVIVVVAVSVVIPWILIIIADAIHLWLGLAVRTIMCCQLLATKSLKDESMKVYEKLSAGDLEGARYAVSMIVGRDTDALSIEGVTKAAVETVAENTSDGIIAPLFYLAIGGPILGFFYKAINTMDSMVGYKNEKYLNFGRAAAKLDDMVNYLPARISGWLMILSTVFLNLDTQNAKKIYLRDRYNHASPNSAHTEAVAAGALDVQLAGDAIYFGKLYPKKTIGDAIRPIETEDIRRVNGMLYMTAFLAVLIVTLIHGAIYLSI